MYYILLGGLAAVHSGGEEEEKYITRVSIKGGAALLPEKLASALGSRVRLNMPLARLVMRPGGDFQLTFIGGEQLTADVVLLAIPCSVYTDISFEGLSQERLEAIQNVQYGTNAKIMVPLKRAVAERPAFAGSNRNGFIMPGSSRIFGFYCSGEVGHFTAQTLQQCYEAGLPAAHLALGADVLPETAPVYAQDASFCSYTTPVGYSWPNDPFAKGSYAYIAPGQEELFTALEVVRGETVKKMFAPIGTLYFAGEHASILLDVPGTMEAACESGERAARMIKGVCWK